MRFTLSIDLSDTALKTLEDIKLAIVESIWRAGRDGNGTLAPVEVCQPWQIRDTNGNNVGMWEVVPGVLPDAPDAPTPAPAFVCCCCAASVPAPDMPAVRTMPTAAELASIAADAAGLGRSMADLARELASMASVARMPAAAEIEAWQRLGALKTTEGEARHQGALRSLDSCASMPAAAALAPAPAAVEDVANRIDAGGRVAAAAGPTGSPRRRNLASRPSRSQLVATIVADYRANGKDAANATFDTARTLHNLTEVEAKDIAARVRIIVSPTDI